MKSSTKIKKAVVLLSCVLMTGSCSKVAFETKTNNNNPPPTTPTPIDPGTSGNDDPPIKCNVYFNSQVSAVTVAAMNQNPDLYADCTPSNVTLSWTTKNAGGTVVSPSGLHGSSSHPDFYSLGTGVYSVTLHASAANYKDFNSAPITATVNVPPVVLPNINCDVRVNGQTAPVTLAHNGSNPRVTANCLPDTVSYVWTVTQGATNVTVPGLTGSDSTADFLSMTPGTYNIFLQASQAGYQTYNSPSARVVTVQAPPALVNKSFSTTVVPQNNQLDILLIVDDSNSMLPDNKKLAERMEGFVNDLSASGFDWQMCVTVTRPQKVYANSNTLYWGASIFWQGYNGNPAYILKSGTPNTSTIFKNTIDKIGAGIVGSDDERPIKAAWHHLYNGDVNFPNDASGCYRRDAGLAIVMISDEDERSVGGDITQKYYANEYFPLEDYDMPQNLIKQVHDIFGNNKRFVANAILVRPGDTACKASQDNGQAKSHYGVINAQLAQLTNGYVGSICDNDYSQSLRYFKDQIVTQMQSVRLDCPPVGNITVGITPAFTHTYRVEGQSVIFDPAIPAGRTINIQYQCTP